MHREEYQDKRMIMAKYSRLTVATQMYETGMVPVFYHKDLEVAKKVLKACYDGGVRVFEFTNRGDFAHEVFGELNKFALRELPDMILGAGSVVDSPTAALYIQLGANFIVSPILDADMAIICNRRKILWSPGCGSLTEIVKAEELGAEVVKIFPATQVGGPEFIKAIKGPRPMTNIMPTGGVEPTEDNLKKWITDGAYCVGMGSKLMIKKEDGSYDYETILKKSRQAIDIIRSYRKAQ